MRVEINHETIRKGLLIKTTYYEVAISVHFTHEELQIIKQRRLLKTKLVDRRPADARVEDRDDQFELRVEHFLNGKTDRFLCATPSQAKIYEERLLDVFRQMKLWLDDNAETGTKRVIEF